MRKLVLLAVAGAALAAAPAALPREAVAPRLTVKSSRFGRVLFDGRGYVLYAFTREGRAPGRRGREAVAARHDAPPGRPPPGHLCRAAPLLLGRRHEAGQDRLP